MRIKREREKKVTLLYKLQIVEANLCRANMATDLPCIECINRPGDDNWRFLLREGAYKCSPNIYALLSNLHNLKNPIALEKVTNLEVWAKLGNDRA